MLAALVLFALALAAWHHLAWPLLLSRLARRAPRPPAALTGADVPVVTIVMPAHNEEREIGAKIANLAALDWPREKLRILLLLDGCTDGTEAAARAAHAAPDCAGLDLEIRAFTGNRGKLAVLNEAIGAMGPGLVALSDISAHLAPDALRRAVAHFADARQGAVGGGYELTRAGSAGEAMYWRVQTATKKGEAALGAPLGLHGAFWMFRREAWAPLPAGTINDDFVWPCRMVEAGWRVGYDPAIRVTEEEQASAALDTRRRARIGMGNAQQLWLCRGLLHPRHGGVALAFLSGKALRVLMPFILAFAVIGTLVLAPHSPFFAVLAVCEALGLALAGCGALLGDRAPRVLSVLRYLVAGHLASARGVARWMLSAFAGRPATTWRRAGA